MTSCEFRLRCLSSDVCSSDLPDHRGVHLIAVQETGPPRDAIEQARINFGQQARPQAVARVGPPLPTRRIAAPAGYLSQTGITVTVIRPRVARGAGTVSVVVTRRAHEIP